MKRPITIALALGAALAIASCGSSSGSAAGSLSAAHVSTTLDGAGSTLAAPIYEQWADTLRSTGLTVNFNAIGSGAGQIELESATVAFAGSDPPLTPHERSAMKGPVLQFPVAAGAIAVSYNLPRVKSGLDLNGSTLAAIFSGRISRWNAPAIRALNRGVRLPALAITVIHRSDSSGTTDGFTSYLSDVSPTWRATIGAGKDVLWPVGTGAPHNSGVAAAIKQTTGAIGYLEQAYALASGFAYAAVSNGSGAYLTPTIADTSSAFVGIRVPANLGISTIDSPNPSAYPIVSQTFLDAYRDPCRDGGLDAATARGLHAFLSYAFGAGQRTLGGRPGQLPYAPLPSSLAARDRAQLTAMTCDGAALS